MAEPIALAIAVVDAMERRDLTALHSLVPEHYWGWLDDYLQAARGWPAIEELAGTPRARAAARAMGPNMARVTIEGPRGPAFVTATFDERDQIKGFALDGEEYEGIGTVVITCPDDRTEELGAFYAALVGSHPRRRPRLNFDEGNEYRPPRWPDPKYPQQLHLDIHVRDLDASHRLVLDRGATLLADAGAHHTYADPIGHPFCLYPGDDDTLWRVVIDCPDAPALSAFYAELLAGDNVPELAFQEVTHYVAPRWPDPAFPAQAHFDVKVDDRAPVEARIERAGAVRLSPQGGSCPTYADPAGHPFCVCLHGE
ncbi:MAG TPA: VOC family protein [Acidimicrobiales bacterium]|nr:VOC family protein [Acidimicrobiales bacterium]